MKLLQKKLDYYFKNISLLERALTHRSYSDQNNERLEFLGDSLLNFYITEKLFHACPDHQEGDMSRLRASLVNGEMLAQLAKELGISQHIKMGMGELNSGGLERKSTLADTIEAIIGAIYLDAGIDICKQEIEKLFSDMFIKITARGVQKDPKTTLQEYAQAQQWALPVYTTIFQKNDIYTPIFRVKCQIPNLSDISEGTGRNRKNAEQDAAQRLLILLGIIQ